MTQGLPRGEVKHLRPVGDDEPSLPPSLVEAFPLVPRRRERKSDGGTGGLSLALRLVILIVLATLSAFLLAPRLVRGDLPDDPKLVGSPARSFVKADRDYALVDNDATGELRDAAASRSLSVWDLDTGVAVKEAQLLHKSLVRLAVALEPVREGAALKEPMATAKVPQAALTAAEPVRAVLAGELALAGLEAPPDDVWRALVKAIWEAPGLTDGLHDTIVDALAEPVVSDTASLARDAARGIVVRAVPTRPGGERVLDTAGIADVQGARARAAEAVVARLLEEAQGLTRDEAQGIAGFVTRLIGATLTYNAAETDARRRRDAEDVPPVIVRAHRGELVLRPGEVITPRHRLLVQAMKVQQAGDMRTRAVLGTGFFVALLCLVVYLFGARRVFRRTLRTKDIAFLSTLLLLVLLGIVAADAITPFLQARVPSIPAAVLFFAVPVALGAMTVRLTLPPDVALLFSVVVALLGGVVVEPGMSWSVVAVVTSLTGAAGVSRSQRRSTMLLAGIGAGLAGAFAALTLELFRGALVGVELAWLLGATFAGGVLSGLLVVVVTPVVEALFGYVTEQRLYKLADLNHPLLKDLIVHAPGTWHHSMRVAELAEEAAGSVGASPILARVMALYHDVGKMKHPQHFGENQKGDNPHDRLPPERSAELLKAHVTDGLTLAAEHGIPRAVAAAIEEHHVDNMLEGFYAKARASAEPGAVVDAAAFRYAGRPPQSRESALVMLADQIEAAARSLDDPSPERLAGVVDAFVSRAIADDTLLECDLSLRDLGRARDALHHALLRVHRHDRTEAG
jgi:hypothetical protein